MITVVNETNAPADGKGRARLGMCFFRVLMLIIHSVQVERILEAFQQFERDQNLKNLSKSFDSKFLIEKFSLKSQ